MRYFFGVLSYSIKYFFHYRGSSLIWVLAQLIYQYGMYLTTQIYFKLNNHVANLSVNQFLIYLASYQMILSFYFIFIEPSHDLLPDRIYDGELDFYLIKPVNSFILANFSRFGIESILSLVFPVWMLFKIDFFKINDVQTLTVYFIILLMAAMFYGLVMSIAVLFTFWSTLNISLWKSAECLLESGSRPMRSYPSVLQVLFKYALPIPLIMNLPADFLIEGYSFKIFLTSFVSLFATLLFVLYLWRKGLKQYASAG